MKFNHLTIKSSRPQKEWRLISTSGFKDKDNMIDLKKIICAYDRFVPHRLLQLLGKKDITKIKLGDNVEKKITILFSDIRDFTTLSESLTPQENFNFINTYLCQMDPIISSNNGVVGNFIGDAIMAIFPEGTEDAYKCSLSMLKQLRVYNEGRIRAGYQPIRIGIGLNTGLAMIGTVGGHNRMDGTVISDAVNLCSRIESLTKVYKIQLLIGEDTYNDLSPERKKYTRFVDRVLVKGKLKQQSIYEVFEIDDEHVRKHKRNSKHVFEEALANYHYGEIDVAKRLLEECLSRNVNDEPLKIYLDRCEKYLATGYHESDCLMSDRVLWSDQFLLGHELIDTQHRELVEGSLALIEAVEQEIKSEEIKKRAMEFAEKARIHFKTEEAILEKCDYPFLEFQKQQHNRFMTTFSYLADDLSNKSTSRIFCMFKIQIFLIDWIVHHTLKDDKNYGKYLTCSD